jgi:dihydrodipicolinate synthase/N-acetylneuraminate lyase
MTYNLFPRLFVEIYRAVAGGKLARALELQLCYIPFLDLVMKYGIFQAVDHLMRQKGYDSCSFRRPRQRLDAEAGARMMRELEPILQRMSATLGNP